MILWSLTNWKRLFELNNGEQAYTVDVTSQIDGSLARVSIRAHEMTGQWVRPYELIETLGKGGMGVVYLARRAGRWGQATSVDQFVWCGYKAGDFSGWALDRLSGQRLRTSGSLPGKLS
jgi:serine/threonine protein kinase